MFGWSNAWWTMTWGSDTIVCAIIMCPLDKETFLMKVMQKTVISVQNVRLFKIMWKKLTPWKTGIYCVQHAAIPGKGETSFCFLMDNFWSKKELLGNLLMYSFEDDKQLSTITHLFCRRLYWNIQIRGKRYPIFGL